MEIQQSIHCFFIHRSFSPKPQKAKKLKQNNPNYPPSNVLQLTDELINRYNQAKQLEATHSLKWKLCQDLFSIFVDIVPSNIPWDMNGFIDGRKSV